MSGMLTSAVRFALCLSTSLFAVAAAAGYELYKDGDTKIELDFMVVGAQFGNDTPWFGESRSFTGASVSHWTEFGTEPGLKFETGLGGGTFFGEVSGVYTHTSGDDASGVTSGYDETSETTLEQGNLGWKIGDVFSALEDDTVSVQIGRMDYSIGTGMLVTDGGSDGGDRGGWYLGLRKAFQNAAIVGLDSKTLKAQVFHLKNNPRRGGNQGEGNGLNVEYTFAESLTLGGTYMSIDDEQPNSDNLDVYDGRADWQATEAWSFGGEFAYQTNDNIDANGYFAQTVYEFADVAWKPAFTYRYAEFDDDFNGIAYGYTDYGYWFQGEVAGNYPLANTNLTSNMLRAKLQPHEDVVVNLFYYNFKLSDASRFNDFYGGGQVTSDEFGDEVDLTVDWQATERIYVIGVLGALAPGDAAEQWVGGDDDWLYAMFYLSYTL